MVLSEFSLEGKVALVTGGSRGIGAVTAIGLAKAGVNVAVASRKLADLEKVAAEIRRLGRKSLAVEAHIGRMNELQPLVDKVVAEFGRIDILVNNAGTNPVMAPVLELEERAWDTIINLNMKGLFFLSQAVARVMKENGGGRIINVASVFGYKPDVGNGIYSISKAGIIQITRVLALEFAEYNIRVNAIAPGFVNTRMTNARWTITPDDKPKYLEKILMKRFAEPEELVGTMIYLASDASSYMTGETIIVDGGFLVR